LEKSKRLEETNSKSENVANILNESNDNGDGDEGDLSEIIRRTLVEKQSGLTNSIATKTKIAVKMII